MDVNIGLEHYEVIYKAVLASLENIQSLKKSIKKVEELQKYCRCCGCLDDGTFTELDASQDFELEPSIRTYRALIQRNSLQFQFHTMPDLPNRICAKCGYIAKIFFNYIRLFGTFQLGMRYSVTDWYQINYSVEAPEQPEDKIQLMKQLLMAKAVLCKKQRETPRKYQIQNSVKDLIKQGAKIRNADYKRSVSADDRLNAGCGKNRGNAETNVPGKNLKGGQMARSTVNLKSSNPTVKATKGYQNQFVNSQKSQQSQTARSDISKIGHREMPNREKTIIIKTNGSRECPVTPRVSKMDRLQCKPNPNRKILEAATAAGGSKAQLQQKLQERRRQWR